MVEHHFAEQWERLLFRDYLIAHPQVSKEYENLKIDLASAYPNDRVAYTNGKTEFIVKVTEQAKYLNKQVVLSFVDAINRQDIGKILSLMTDDHKFVDALGNEVAGKEKMKIAWTGYFQLFQDYRIEVADMFVNGDTIAVFGFASGTYKGTTTDKNENYWRLPAAWKAIVEKGKVKFWQVYADTKMPYDIIDSNTRQ
jgi:ketosteroid isomerase-like protein